MAGFEVWSAARAKTIILAEAERAAPGERPGTALPMLHALQDAFGYVDQQAVPLIAETLNLSRAEVFGTISFYHDFRSTPPGRHMFKFCRAEACQSVGAVELHAHCKASLGIDWHGTTSDGAITLEPVFCLGLCASGPAALIDDKPVARLDAAKVDTLVARARA
jgi:formate dehydrogenase subunit gamma